MSNSLNYLHPKLRNPKLDAEPHRRRLLDSLKYLVLNKVVQIKWVFKIAGKMQVCVKKSNHYGFLEHLPAGCQTVALNFTSIICTHTWVFTVSNWAWIVVGHPTIYVDLSQLPPDPRGASSLLLSTYLLLCYHLPGNSRTNGHKRHLFFVTDLLRVLSVRCKLKYSQREQPHRRTTQGSRLLWWFYYKSREV